MGSILLRLLYYLVIAFFVGTVAQYITGYHRQRVFSTFLLGFVGVILGDFFSYRLNLPPHHAWFFFFGISIPWSLIGAVLVVLVYRLLRGRW